MAIEQCRRYRPSVRTYIVQKNDDDKPDLFFYKLIPKLHETILPGEVAEYEKISGYPGWWKIPGHPKLNTSPVFVWLGGFEKFCDNVVNNGLPE